MSLAAGASAMPAPLLPLSRSRGSDLGGQLAAGMETLAGQQLPSGEIPSFRRDADGRWQVCPDVLASTLAHDALGCFDPGSPWGESHTTDLLHPTVLPGFLSRVLTLRRRIRGFVAWHEEARGNWHAAGRGSGLGPDAAVTAAAAAVLLEGGPRARHQPWRRHQRALTRLRAQADPLTSAHVARFLVLVGQDATEHLAVLARAIEEGESDAGLMPLAHASARIFRHGLQPGRQAMAEILVPRILPRLAQAGVLERSLAISALLDLGFGGPELIAAGRTLGQQLAAPSTVSWYDACGPEGGASPALTLALALTSLARWAVTTRGGRR